MLLPSISTATLKDDDDLDKDVFAGAKEWTINFT
jgi:hypothetical protein